MVEKIARYKAQADWTVAEVVANRRDGTVPENPEYVEARRKALENAGLESEGDSAGDDGELTTGDYLKKIQAGGRP